MPVANGGLDGLYCKLGTVQLDSATSARAADSGLDGFFCTLGRVELNRVEKRIAPQKTVLSSGPSLYGLGSHDCKLDSMRLDAAVGFSRLLNTSTIYTHMSKRIKHASNISGPNVQSHRSKRLLHTSNIIQTASKRLLHWYTINPAIETGETVGPFTAAILTNEPHADDGPPGFMIGNAKTGSYTDLTEIPYHFMLNMNESQSSTWSLSIVDPLGKYSPLKLNSPYSDLMDEQPFGPAGTYTSSPYGTALTYPTQVGMVAASSDQPGSGGSSQTQVNQYVTKVQLDVVKELLVTATIGKKPWEWRGIGTAWTHTRNWETKYFNFCWKGNDYSILLNKENQNMQTIRSTGSNTRKLTAAAQEILSKYGVRYDFSRYAQSDDFVIPFMNLSDGSPYDWVTQLTQTLLYEWFMKGGTTFTPYLPCSLSGSTPHTYDKAAASPTFTYDFTQTQIMEEQYDGSMQAMYNQVIGTRAAQGGQQKYEVECFDFNDGYSIEFNPPLSAVSWRHEYNNNGQASDLRFYRGDTLVAVQNITSGSINYGLNVTNGGMMVGITRVTFTWGVLPGGFIGTGSPGKVSFRGVEEVEPGVWGGTMLGTQIDQGPANPAPQLRAFAENRALINRYGLRPTRISASSLIPTQAVLQKFCDRMLFRLSRQARKATYKIPLNPFIEPGCLIREIDYSLGSLASPLIRDRVVQSCTHSFSSDPSNRYTTYSGSEYVEFN